MKNAKFAWLGCALIALSVANANATLTHLYTFNDGTTSDSVGSDKGNLIHGATVSGGQLVFNPAINNGSNNPNSNTGQYMGFSSNPANTPSFSFEIWATDNSDTPWQRLIDLNSGTSSFQMFTTNSYPAQNQGMLGQVSIGGSTSFVTTPVHPTTGVEHQFVYAYDMPSATESLYLDGSLISQATNAYTNPAAGGFTSWWVGRSPFSTDPFFDGSFDEIRIYDSAITPTQVAADAVAGPAVPEPASMSVGAMTAVLVLRRRRNNG